ncbi:hypothetical protein RCL_jg1229.t1 [Rhizophagus clarus]|uniref:Uncharacterized protein n=1 Tax=Rhizophagus clarus TaxID=94130 RepID=A0A8H3LB13_9GLOM|nr:hypothetical protein RCL_jg1229.t1 [Rhizophagus clarus]
MIVIRFLDKKISEIKKIFKISNTFNDRNMENHLKNEYKLIQINEVTSYNNFMNFSRRKSFRQEAAFF